VKSGYQPRVAVIGGGISGLAAAHRIFELSRDHRRPVEIRLFEAGERLGGVVKTERRDGFVLEHGPDTFLSEKPAGLQLCERLGITGRLINTQEQFRRTYVAFGGALHPLPDGFSLMAPTRLTPLATSGLFTFGGKLRMALDLVLPRREMEDESLESFVTRRLGRQAMERVAQPLVGGIYTADPATLSLAATMPRFLQLERDHGSIIRGLRAESRTSEATRQASGARWSLFLSFADGMETLVHGLRERLPRNSILCGRAVRSIARRDTGWQLDDGETFDAVVVALPAPLAGRTLRGVDAALAADLESIRYASSAVVNLAYPRELIPHPLDGFGFVVPHVENRKIIACSFSFMKYARRAPAGFALLRAFVGGALGAELSNLPDDDMIAAVRGELRDILGVAAAPSLALVSRYPDSMPQYQVGHLRRLRRIEKRVAALPQLQLAGNAYRGVGIPDCIASGERAAEAIFPGLTTASASAAA
jgi:protoporphyrinogen/coproporphyrinogen III oxidase